MTVGNSTVPNSFVIEPSPYVNDSNSSHNITGNVTITSVTEVNLKNIEEKPLCPPIPPNLRKTFHREFGIFIQYFYFYTVYLYFKSSEQFLFNVTEKNYFFANGIYIHLDIFTVYLYTSLIFTNFF